MYRFIQRVLGGVLYTLLLIPCPDAISMAGGEKETMKNRLESVPCFDTELDPVYLRWVLGPGALRGFWSAHPRAETKERTGANTFSSHISLHLIEDPKEPGGFRIDSPFAPFHSTVEMGFRTLKPMTEIRVLVSTAFEGAAGTAELYRIERGGEWLLVGSREQVNARADSWVVVKPERQDQSLPAGQYVLVVKARKLKVEVWPGPSADTETWTGFPEAGVESRQQRTALLASVSYSDGTTNNLRQDEEQRPWLSLGSDHPGSEAVEAGMYFNVDLGEHNNPYFIYYPAPFQTAFPNAFMRDLDGNPIRIGWNPIREIENPVAAVDDPDLRCLSKTLVQQGAEFLRDSPWLRYYVIGGEECYPDYFGTLPVGDFRKAFTDRFDLYSLLKGWRLNFNREVFRADPQGRLGRAWYLFREHAMADRAADYMRAFLEKDPHHPVFYPTHGNPFFGPGQSGRKQLGYSPGLIAGACDGFETGQISIDTDVEWLNLLTLSHTVSWGVPVVSPRLGNKTLDPSARGGGRSFTPTMMRRLFYEAIGHGVWHTGLLQWTGILGDGEWFIRDTPAEKEACHLFSEIESASPYLMGMSRLQPKVGLYLSDATWLHEGWQARWTGFYQDALSDHWQIALVGDQMLGTELVSKIPVLISLDNSLIDSSAIGGLSEYLAAGGRLIRWGEFARADELGTPFERDPLEPHREDGEKEDLTPPSPLSRWARGGLPPSPCGRGGMRGVRSNVVTLQVPPKQQRELLNACTTGSGAHKHVTQYQAAPFMAIREAILSKVPESVLCPVKLETADKVHAYTLTDGMNLTVVLVNHQAEPAAVSLEPPTICSWHWKRIDLPSKASDQPTPGPITLNLEGYGSALVWITPDVDLGDCEEQLRECREILGRWVNLGADVDTLRVCLDEADKARMAGIAPKAYALSMRILNGLGIHAEIVPGASGISRIHASILDPSGKPVTGANVICRIVPGSYRWCSLTESKGGVYETDITRENLPDLFNPEKGCYESYTGPVRLIMHASQEDRGGYYLQTAMTGEAPP